MLVFAHPSLALLRVLEKQEFYGWGKSLKILVSVVRFRPRPPGFNAQLLAVGRFHLHKARTLRDSGPLRVCRDLRAERQAPRLDQRAISCTSSRSRRA
jgi:hypothetical protein